MIDIKLIRENPEIIKENIRKKFQEKKISLVDEVLELDSKWRNEKKKLDNLRSERNKISESINKLIKEGKKLEADKLISKAKEIPREIEKIEEKSSKLELEIKQRMYKIPNLIDK